MKTPSRALIQNGAVFRYITSDYMKIYRSRIKKKKKKKKERKRKKIQY